MKKNKKKTSFQVLAESLVLEGLKDFDLPTPNTDCRKLTVDEIKEIIKEEFEKAKDAAHVKTNEPEGGWGDAELAKAVDWLKKLDIKEVVSLFEREDYDDEDGEVPGEQDTGPDER